MTKVLITGAGGQIGTVLTQKLRETHGSANVIATDIMPNEALSIYALDILDYTSLQQYVTHHQVTEIYHLAAILSASGERNPQKAWEVNMKGWFNVLEVSNQNNVSKVFFPSTIAAFGMGIPLVDTPNYVPMIPSTVYGISKVSGELWGKYYFDKYGLDVRSLRYPGVVSHQSMPGGGTTDYAVEIFHFNARNLPYTCFLAADTTLPMIYIDDTIRATLELMQAPKQNISVRTSYNLSGVSFSPEELYQSILRHSPEFKISYEPDYRQQIALTWPQSIDDSLARNDWGWKPEYDLNRMTEEMIYHLSIKYQASESFA